MSYQNYYDKMKISQLPEDFDQWLLPNHKNTTTLAHEAAKLNKLPLYWTSCPEDWLQKDNLDFCVAHYAAKNGCLPTDWTDDPRDWLVKDRFGSTIAHIAASKNALPEDFPYLEFKNSQSITIGLRLFQSQHFPLKEDIYEFSQDIKKHILPCFNNLKLNKEDSKSIHSFMSIFYHKLNEASVEELMTTSEQYSGFLLNHVESIISEIVSNHNPNNYHYHDIILKTEKLVNEKTLNIKEMLFSRYSEKKYNFEENFDLINEL